MDFIEQFEYHWLWFGLALLLMVLEVFSNRFLFMAASVGALLVGIQSHLFPYVSFPVQLLFFVILAGASMWMARAIVKERLAKVEKFNAIFQSRRYVGQQFTLDYPMLDGQGTIEIEGESWRLVGPDCPAGGRIRVLDMGGDSDGVKTLKVEPVGDK